MVQFFPGSRKLLFENGGPKGTASWCKGQAGGIESGDAALFPHPDPSPGSPGPRGGCICPGKWQEGVTHCWGLAVPLLGSFSPQGSLPAVGTVLVPGEKTNHPIKKKGEVCPARVYLWGVRLGEAGS